VCTTVQRRDFFEQFPTNRYDLNLSFHIVRTLGRNSGLKAQDFVAATILNLSGHLIFYRATTTMSEYAGLLIESEHGNDIGISTAEPDCIRLK
jgi:hypothetical protein